MLFNLQQISGGQLVVFVFIFALTLYSIAAKIASGNDEDDK